MLRPRHALVLIVAATLAGCQTATDEGSAEGKAGAGGAARKAVAPAPTPKPQPATIPEGTELALKLETTVSSATSREGELIVARLIEDLSVGGKVVAPAGSEVRGHVTAAVPGGRVKGRARLAFVFDTLVAKGQEHAIEATGFDATAGSTKKRDAAMIGGGTVLGAIIGGKKGAVVGAAAGGGAVLATKGKDIEVGAGQTLTIKLKAPSQPKGP